MQITRSDADGTVLLKVEGCLDTTAAADFGRAVEEIPVGAREVVFDFSGLEFIASSALRAMVALGKRLGGTGAVKVSGANDVVRDVFEVTGLDEVFELVRES